ncbi:MAG: hypothetical protein JKY56_20545 [Kofleriaceae bacterium]|nr:hypothetical protein [Kofleriaceae bacterium]
MKEPAYQVSQRPDSQVAGQRVEEEEKERPQQAVKELAFQVSLRLEGPAMEEKERPRQAVKEPAFQVSLRSDSRSEGLARPLQQAVKGPAFQVSRQLASRSEGRRMEVKEVLRDLPLVGPAWRQLAEVARRSEVFLAEGRAE